MASKALNTQQLRCLLDNFRIGGLVQAKLAFPDLSLDQIKRALVDAERHERKLAKVREKRAQEQEALVEQPGYVHDGPDPDTICRMCAKFRARHYAEMVKG